MHTKSVFSLSKSNPNFQLDLRPPFYCMRFHPLRYKYFIDNMNILYMYKIPYFQWASKCFNLVVSLLVQDTVLHIYNSKWSAVEKDIGITTCVFLNQMQNVKLKSRAVKGANGFKLYIPLSTVNWNAFLLWKIYILFRISKF